MTVGPEGDESLPDPASDGPVDTSLRSRAIEGGASGALWSLVAQVTSVVTTTVLARHLSPRDIGLVAAAMVVIGLFEVIASVGLAATVVQQRVTDQRSLATLFWASAGLGALVAGFASATAPLTAGVLDEPDVAGLVVAISLVSGIGFLRAVPNAVLHRDLRYRTAYGISSAAAVVTAAVTIALAILTDQGPAVIVIGRLCGVLLETVADFAAAHWRPAAAFDTAFLRRNTRFSLGVWAAQVSTYGSKNFDYWAVGRTAGAAALGLYYIAFVLPNILRQRVTWVVQTVLFPLLSRVHDDRRRLADGYTEAVAFLSFVSFPVLLGLAAISAPVVEVFFGDRWSGAARTMSILAVAASLEAPFAAAPTVVMARGRPALAAVATGARLLVFVPALLLAVTFSDGLAPVAGAVLLSAAMSSVLWCVLIRREIAVGFGAVAAAALPFAVSAMVMALAVDLVERGVASMNPIAALVVLVVVGAAVYFVMGLVVAPRQFKRLSKDVASIFTSSALRRPLVD